MASVKSSQTITAYMLLQAGQYTASQGSMAVSFAYNSADIQSISIGVPQSSASVPAMSFVTTNSAQNPGFLFWGIQNTQVTFLVPSVYNFLYSTGTGTSVSAAEIPVVITTGSSYGTNNEVVSIQVTPGTTFFNTTNGNLVSGQYKNPQTNANLFAPVVAANAIILKGAA